MAVQSPNYVLLCYVPLGPALDPYVKTGIKISKKLWLVVPVTNSAARRIAERVWHCTKYLARDASEVIRLVEVLARFTASGDYGAAEVNDLRDYPSIVYNEETVYEDGRVAVTYYNAGEADGYVARSKITGDVMHVYTVPL